MGCLFPDEPDSLSPGQGKPWLGEGWKGIPSRVVPLSTSPSGGWQKQGTELPGLAWVRPIWLGSVWDSVWGLPWNELSFSVHEHPYFQVPKGSGREARRSSVPSKAKSHTAQKLPQHSCLLLLVMSQRTESFSTCPALCHHVKATHFYTSSPLL